MKLYLMTAFATMGLKYNTSSDASCLGEGITGVYFGPQPSELEAVDKQRLLNLQAGKFTYEVTAIERRNSKNSATRTQEGELIWNEEVKSWLQLNFGEAAWAHFQGLSSLDEKRKYLTRPNCP